MNMSLTYLGDQDSIDTANVDSLSIALTLTVAIINYLNANKVLQIK